MVIKFKRLNHVAVNMPQGEVEKVREFYRDVLQLKEVAPPKLDHPDIFEFIWFEMADFLLHFRFVLPPLSQKKPESMLMNDSDKAHFAVEVENIHDVRKEIESRGGEIFETIPLVDRDRFMMTDLYGNAMEIIEMHCDQKR